MRYKNQSAVYRAGRYPRSYPTCPCLWLIPCFFMLSQAPCEPRYTISTMFSPRWAARTQCSGARNYR